MKGMLVGQSAKNDKWKNCERTEWFARRFFSSSLLSERLGQPSRVTTVREKSGKTKTFQGQGKVREFCKRSGKILEVCKSQ